MTTLAVILVLGSAVAHVGWNLLAKRSAVPDVFMCWMAVSASILVAPFALYFLLEDFPSQAGWLFAAATSILHVGYFVALGRAYRGADLSLAYPLARGFGLMLIPVLGVMLLGERMSGPAVAGVFMIIAGVFTISLWGRFQTVLRTPLDLLRQTGIKYALLTGAIIAAYSIVDKQGVQHVSPFVYMFLLNTGAGVGMIAVIRGRHGQSEFTAEWRENYRGIIVAGLLQFTAYGLVLAALTISPISYVAPFREVGIVLGVVTGAILLKEPFGAGRTLSAGLILAGVVAIAMAP